MRKFAIIFALVFFSIFVSAQNNFIYLRYDLSQGSASGVVTKIGDIIRDSRGQFVIYYSDGASPVICTKFEEWEKLRSNILSQQTSPDYYEEEDISRVNKLLTDILHEDVDGIKNLKISSPHDADWTFSFILSEQMLDDANDADIVHRLVSINQLMDRMIVKIYSYSDEDSLSNESLDNLRTKKIYNYENI